MGASPSPATRAGPSWREVVAMPHGKAPRHKALPDERENYKGPSHERHKRRRKRKAERERALRDAWVTEVWGRRGHGGCGRKLRFRCLHEARTFAEAHAWHAKWWAYRCPYCNGWHLTSHPGDDCVEL